MSYLRSNRSTPKRKLIKIKRFWITVAIVSAVLGYLLFTSYSEPENTTFTSKPSTIDKPVADIAPPALPEKFDPPEGSIFIPYWKVTSFSEPVLPETIKHKNVRNIIYFGVTSNEFGALDKSEPGFTNLAKFSEKATSITGRKLLTVRLMNEDITESLLSNTTYQEALINETLALSQQYNFDGLVIDLEHSVLPTKDTVAEISSFLELFATKTQAQDQYFAVALYGDTFYRQRPYDVEKIGSFSDEVLIMAYDFHKSYGEPGPNFPLFKGKAYSYDFATMINDFTKLIPAQKLTVLFGLFGYDWSVDDKNRPAKAGKALTLSNVEGALLPKCPALNCKKERDNFTHEMNISYTDNSGQRHSIWYEDILSLQAKTSYLSTKRVFSIGYWAYGYY